VRAAIFQAFNGDIEIDSVPDPSLDAGGVIVEVRANGVCRSDWHGWVGHDPSIPLPHVPGHEMAGVIAEVGSGVERFNVGERVTVPFALGCGHCPQCLAGNQHICDNQIQPGFSTWGSFAEFVAVPYADGNLVALPDSMSFDTAAGLGCRFATAFRAVVDQGAVATDDWVAVWGCGGVGLSSVMIATALGAQVIAVDISDDALALASAVGATHTVNVSSSDSGHRAVRELSDGGCHVSIDALGSTSTALGSIRSLRKRGRHIQAGLMIGDHARPEIPMWRLHTNEIELFGSHGMQAWRYPEMLAMVADGTLRPDTLVTKTMSLSEGAEHLVRMNEFPGTGFAVITDFTS
jgi:alcohol dehydrogenase